MFPPPLIVGGDGCGIILNVYQSIGYLLVGTHHFKASKKEMSHPKLPFAGYYICCTVLRMKGSTCPSCFPGHHLQLFETKALKSFSQAKQGTCRQIGWRQRDQVQGCRLNLPLKANSHFTHENRPKNLKRNSNRIPTIHGFRCKLPVCFRDCSRFGP